ncbi:MAG: ribosome-associated translation inhibitor RaiA [Brachybacterium sp.]|nr:ribosome-associated translation inhibitor RaiA [Brachybacterium sp.]
MEINVVGRHMDVPERFQRHLSDKLDKVTQLAPAALRVEVEISHEKNPRRAEEAARVELTVHDAGGVIRSEARADDLYAALDVAYGKLLERLRRSRDRRKDRHRGRGRGHHRTETVRGRDIETEMPAALVEEQPAEQQPEDAESDEDVEDDGPMVIREKKHTAAPMTIDDALYSMELVGHDFFLFVDRESGNPKVVYRRKGFDYGVIELEVEEKTA